MSYGAMGNLLVYLGLQPDNIAELALFISTFSNSKSGNGVVFTSKEALDISRGLNLVVPLSVYGIKHTADIFQIIGMLKCMCRQTVDGNVLIFK